jgi:hypothetical protein
MPFSKVITLSYNLMHIDIPAG